MAKFDGVIDRRELGSAGIIDGRHPAIVKVLEFKGNNGVFASGEIVALDANGKADFYDAEATGSLAKPIGVCVYGVDTSKDTIASVLLHGTVIKTALKNKGVKANAVAVKTLETNTLIWAF
jgi:hypothetical protein